MFGYYRIYNGNKRCEYIRVTDCGVKLMDLKLLFTIVQCSTWNIVVIKDNRTI